MLITVVAPCMAHVVHRRAYLYPVFERCCQLADAVSPPHRQLKDVLHILLQRAQQHVR